MTNKLQSIQWKSWRTVIVITVSTVLTLGLIATPILVNFYTNPNSSHNAPPANPGHANNLLFEEIQDNPRYEDSDPLANATSIVCDAQDNGFTYDKVTSLWVMDPLFEFAANGWTLYDEKATVVTQFEDDALTGTITDTIYFLNEDPIDPTGEELHIVNDLIIHNSYVISNHEDTKIVIQSPPAEDIVITITESTIVPSLDKQGQDKITLTSSLSSITLNNLFTGSISVILTDMYSIHIPYYDPPEDKPTLLPDLEGSWDFSLIFPGLPSIDFKIINCYIV